MTRRGMIKTHAVILVGILISCFTSTLYVYYISGKITISPSTLSPPSNREKINDASLTYDTNSYDDSSWIAAFYPHATAVRLGPASGVSRVFFTRVWDECDDDSSRSIVAPKKWNITNASYDDDDDETRERRGVERNPKIEPHHPGYTGALAAKPSQVDEHNCVPAADWHQYVPSTCNSVHEIDMIDGMRTTHPSSSKDDTTIDDLTLLFHGDMREAWLWYQNHQSSSRPIILKTLRYQKDFNKSHQERQRIDAIASERLTSSPHVVDIYGYCSMTALNEYATGGDFHKATKDETLRPMDMLVYARDSARGLADIHAVGVGGEEEEGTTAMTTMVHHDIRRPNFLLVDGKIKYHDFNQARFLRVDADSGERCGFYWSQPCEARKVDVLPRSPEECVRSGEKVSLTEGVEVYRLGAFFFRMLTNKHPYEFEPECQNYTKDDAQQFYKEALRWIMDKKRTPLFPKTIARSDDPIINMIVRETKIAMTYDIEKRPSAKRLAHRLDVIVERMKKLEKERMFE